MSSIPTASKGTEISAKLFTALLWVVALPSIGYFLYVYAGRYTHFDPAHYFNSHYWPSRWWLVSHLSFSGLALLLGPIQFIPVIRVRYRKVHRWVGRVYLVGVAGGIVTAMYMVFSLVTTFQAARHYSFLASLGSVLPQWPT